MKKSSVISLVLALLIICLIGVGAPVVIAAVSQQEVQGSLIPAQNNAFDLGSPARAWKSLYLSSGTLYIDGVAANLSGNGTAGPQGPQGLQGIQGVQGNNGTAGQQGIQGIQGIQGYPGYSPVKGVDYFDGATGPQGIPGDNGTQGVQGIQGIQGDNGTAGIQGPQGNPGNDGAPGPNTVSMSTLSNITGLYKGSGGYVAQATGGIDYANASHSHSEGDITGLTADLTGKVAITTTVNGHALSSNITVTLGDVGGAAASHTHAQSDVTGGSAGNFLKWVGSAASWVSLTLSDITTALGFTPVPTTTTVNGYALSGNITLTASDVGAADASLLVPKTTTVNGNALSSNVTITLASLSGVPTSTTVNGNALSSNVTITLGSLSGVPTTTTVNGHALSANVTVTLGDLGAAATSQALDAFGATTDNTSLNASTSAHGLLPKLSNVVTQFLNGTGGWTAPTLSGYVPTTTTVNGNALSSNVTITLGSLSGVPTSTTVNGNALSSNVTITLGSLSGVPTSTTVNGHALSANVTVTLGDLGAASTSQALDAFGATTDNTSLNASISAHGLLPKLSNVVTQFLNGTGGWTVPTASVNITTGTSTNMTGLIYGNGSTLSSVAAPSGTVVGTTDNQTLTTKLLTTPVIATLYQTWGGGLITVPASASAQTIVTDISTVTMTNKTLTTPIIPSLYQVNGGGLIGLPVTAVATTLVGDNLTQTLTNKTLTTPVIAIITNTANLTVPTTGGTLATTAQALDSHGATTDNATLNTSITAHGLAPKLSNTATTYLSGVGTWTVPPGAGGTATQYSQSVTGQGPGFATDTYLTGSAIAIPATGVKIGTRYYALISLSKTAAGAVKPIFNLRFGASANTSDTIICAFNTFPLQTGVADNATVEVWATFNAAGATANVSSSAQISHGLSITGFSTLVSPVSSINSTAFDSTIASGDIGLSANGGTSAVWTIRKVIAQLENLP